MPPQKPPVPAPVPMPQRGEPGPAGPKGDKGEPGKDADLRVVIEAVRQWFTEHKDELRGPQGERGEQGPKGDSGASVDESKLAGLVAEIDRMRKHEFRIVIKDKDGNVLKRRDGSDNVIRLGFDKDGELTLIPVPVVSPEK